MWRLRREEGQLMSPRPSEQQAAYVSHLPGPCSLHHLGSDDKADKRFLPWFIHLFKRSSKPWNKKSIVLCEIVLWKKKKVWWGMQIGTNFLKDMLHYYQLFSNSRTLIPVIPLLGICLKKIIRNSVKDLCTRKKRFMCRFLHWSLIYDSKKLENSLNVQQEEAG